MQACNSLVNASVIPTDLAGLEHFNIYRNLTTAFPGDAAVVLPSPASVSQEFRVVVM